MAPGVLFAILKHLRNAGFVSMAFLAVVLGKLCVLQPAGPWDLQRTPTHVTVVKLAFKIHMGTAGALLAVCGLLSTWTISFAILHFQTCSAK